jgi:hypothetical protein
MTDNGSEMATGRWTTNSEPVWVEVEFLCFLGANLGKPGQSGC